MSRAATGDVAFVKATNNVYTVLVAAAFIAQALAFLVIYLRYTAVFGGNIFSS